LERTDLAGARDARLHRGAAAVADRAGAVGARIQRPRDVHPHIAGTGDANGGIGRTQPLTVEAAGPAYLNRLAGDLPARVHLAGTGDDDLERVGAHIGHGHLAGTLDLEHHTAGVDTRGLD